MSARRIAEIGAKTAVPVLAAGLLSGVLLDGQGFGAQHVAARHEAPHEVALDQTQLVCPGPETIGVRGASSVGAAPAAARVVGAAAPADVRPSVPGPAQAAGTLTFRQGGDPATAKVLAQQGAAGSSGSVAGSTSSALSPVLDARGSAAPGAVAEQSSLVATGDQRALTAAPCTRPGDDLWLVGGGDDAGRRGRLVISNPHEATTTASVDVLSTSGQVARTPGSTVAVPPHSRVVLLLDALAPSAGSPVVHVRSTGGSVAATLDDAWLEGTTPRGADDVVPSLAPSRSVLVPGVRVAGSALLRLASTSGAEAVAQVRLLGEKGPVDLPGGGVVRVPAGSTADVDLSQVSAGAYTVQVTADAPVVAGALVQRRSSSTGPGELAWSASSDVVTSLAGLADAGLGGQAATELVLGAPSDADAQVDVVSVAADGTASTTSVQVTGRTTKVVAVSGASVWLRPSAASGPVVAARFDTHADAAGPMISTGPLRQADLTRLPADVAPAAS